MPADAKDRAAANRPVPMTSARRQAGRVASTLAAAGDTRAPCAHCGGRLPPRRRRFCCDLCRLRGQKAERVTETGDFGRFAIRVIQTMARRVGASDLAAFGAMWEVRTEADSAVVDAIDGLLKSGYSWREIAMEIGWKRHRLFQWHARRARDPAFMEREQPGAAGGAA